MVLISYLVHYDTLLQNETFIVSKCVTYFIKNWDKTLLQNRSDFLLQNAIVLLQYVQYVTVIIKYINFITKCDSLQIVTFKYIRIRITANWKNKLAKALCFLCCYSYLYILNYLMEILFYWNIVIIYRLWGLLQNVSVQLPTTYEIRVRLISLDTLTNVLVYLL